MTATGPQLPRTPRRRAGEPLAPDPAASLRPAQSSLEAGDEPTIPRATHLDHEHPRLSGRGGTVLLVVLGLIAAALLAVVVLAEVGWLN